MNHCTAASKSVNETVPALKRRAVWIWILRVYSVLSGILLTILRWSQTNYLANFRAKRDNLTNYLIAQQIRQGGTRSSVATAATTTTTTTTTTAAAGSLPGSHSGKSLTQGNLIVALQILYDDLVIKTPPFCACPLSQAHHLTHLSHRWGR
jgi:hypothetical protein